MKDSPWIWILVGPLLGVIFFLFWGEVGSLFLMSEEERTDLDD